MRAFGVVIVLEHRLGCTETKVIVVFLGMGIGELKAGRQIRRLT